MRAGRSPRHGRSAVLRSESRRAGPWPAGGRSGRRDRAATARTTCSHGGRWCRNNPSDVATSSLPSTRCTSSRTMTLGGHDRPRSWSSSCSTTSGKAALRRSISTGLIAATGRKHLERSDQAGPELGAVAVALVQREPRRGQGGVLRPTRQQHRLAGPGRGDDDREWSGDDVVQQLEEALPADVVLGSARARAASLAAAQTAVGIRGDSRARPTSPTPCSVSRTHRSPRDWPPRDEATESRREALTWSGQAVSSTFPSVSRPDASLNVYYCRARIQSIRGGVHHPGAGGVVPPVSKRRSRQGAGNLPPNLTGEPDDELERGDDQRRLTRRRTAGAGSAVAVDARV